MYRRRAFLSAAAALARTISSDGARGSYAAFVALILLSASACTESGSRSTVARAGTDTASLRLDPRPVARIGGPGQAQELYKVYGAVLTDGGRLAVGNSSSGEIRWFDQAGAPLSASGGKGSGPGEFQGINWIGRLSGDSIIVYDMRLQRFSVLDPAGSVARTFRSETPGGPGWPVGLFADGTLLVAANSSLDPRRYKDLARDSLLLYRMTSRGETGDVLGTFAGVDWLVYAHPSSFRVTQLPFGRAGRLAATGSHFFYNSSDSPDVYVYDTSGEQVSTIRLAVQSRSLDPDEITEYLETEIPDDVSRAAIRSFMQREGDGTAPVVTDLRADPHGNVWIRLGQQMSGDSVKWLIYSPSASLIGSVLLSPTDHPLDLRADLALIRERDGDDVETVTLRRVTP